MEILERIYIALWICALCAVIVAGTACGLVLLVAYTVKRVKNRRAEDG